MIRKNKDIVIAALEIAREKLVNGENLDRSALSNLLLEKGYFKPEDIAKIDHLIPALHDQICSYQIKGTPFYKLMGLDSYLGLLDYEELQLARQDSAQAREEARLAIQHAEEATRLTKQALFWTKFSVIIATIVGFIQIIVALV